MMEWIRPFLIIVICGSLPLLLTLWLLSFVIKKPAIRILITFVIWGVILSTLHTPPHPSPRWALKQSQQRNNLQRVEIGLLSYMGDHDEKLPERFSQLFPEYMSGDDVKFFFDWSAKDFKEQCQKAAVDPAEVDHKGEFDYFEGKIGGMIAASKVPIEKTICAKDLKAEKKLVRVVLGMDMSINTVPEEEYQRRLAGRMPMGAKTP